MFTMVVSGYDYINNFKTQRNFTELALKLREMYVCTCKMIARALTKQMYNKAPC